MAVWKLYFFLNFDDKLALDPDFKWINEPLAFYELGATFTFLHTNQLALMSAFDGVIYVQKSTAAVSLN